MKKYIYIGICLILPLFLIGAAKNDIIQQIKDSLAKYNTNFRQEKAYIQTDKTYYKPTESVWYKGFLSNSSDNKPSAISDVVYVELHDPWGNVAEKHEHNITDGTFNGAFHIPENRAGGIYKMVAYTGWMKNWSEENFFTKEITIQKVITPRMLLKLDYEKRAYGAGDEVVANLKVTDLNNVKTTGSSVKSTVRIDGKEYKTLENKTQDGEVSVRFTLPQKLNTTDGILQIIVTDKGVEESISRSIPIVINKIQVQFFPEGGELVAGTGNKVAFEALNEFGKGADISGEIVDDANRTVTTFESFHLGMGSFSFTPEKGRKYYARITTPAGNETPKELPKSIDNGYVLSLDEKSDKTLKWNIYSPENTGNACIVAHTQGIIQYTKQLSLKKGLNTLEIDTQEFPIGIAVFTLFNGMEESAERLVYLNSHKKLNVKLETDKEVYAPKENVKLSVITTDENGNPVSANLGLAVVDEQILTMADDKQDNLLSYMLFSSELKGKIQEPYFYFDPEEPKAEEARDYLMLTHGWRRFRWNDVLNPSGKSMNLPAERLGSIYGYTLDKDGKPVQTDVYLIEMGGKKRIGKLRTTGEGHFVFHNADMTNGAYISTKLPNQVYIIDGTPVFAKETQTENTEENGILDLSGKTSDKPTALQNVIKSEKRDGSFSSTESFSADQSQLDEVVVVGYGTQRRSSLTSSISIVSQFNPINLETTNDIMNDLAGAVPGITINSRDASPGSTSSIRIRGTSTLSNNEPLVIIDGVPVEGTVASSLGLLNPSDIAHIEVLKDNNAAAIYGSRGANGVILVSTKNTTFTPKYKAVKPKYKGIHIAQRQFYRSPVFIQGAHNPLGENSTVYWNGSIYTNKEGKASVSFVNNNQSSTYRITVEGISPENGLLASTSKRIVTQEEFSIDAKVPLFAGCGDIIKIPVMLKNMTDKALKADLIIETDSLISYHNSDIISEIVAPNMTKTIFVPVTAGQKAGNSQVLIRVKSGKYVDQIVKTITVRQINFPYQFSFSGRALSDKTTFTLPDHIDGSLKAEATTYVQLFDELFDGAESIFREPYGCFEQLLSSSFPNVFAMQLLKATGKNNKEIEDRAMGYLERGYRQLANYETKGTGGFEWYGGSPAHEMLTAYGLVHFYEMRKVYNNVDEKMVNRAQEFLLSRRDGSGGFKQNSGRYGFSGAPADVNNAYIVYAFTEIEKGNLIQPEYEATLEEALKNKDLYRMALLANAAYSMNDLISYKKLIAELREFIAKTDLSKMKIDATIVRSYGEASNREATAYWLLALLKDSANIDYDLIQKCLEYINKGKTGGGFGTTQTTSVCLQALTRYATLVGTKSIEGDFCLSVNGSKECLSLTDIAQKDMRTSIDFTNKLRKGSNDIAINYTNTNNPYSFIANVSWFATTPPTSKLCPLKLSANMGKQDIKVNETVRLSVRLENTEKTAKPMSVAIIGIPGGMSLQPWQLKELQEKEIFDFYEITNDNLVIYYRELGPSETKTIDLDLKAEIAGSYTGIASSAYVYYMNEHKYWINGIKVNIRE